MPTNLIVNRIGMHTLGLYFFSGAIPETLCSVYKHLGEFNDLIIFAIALLSFVIGIMVNELLVRFAPWVFDLRELKKLDKGTGRV